MKKLLLSIVFTSVICFNLPVFSNEIEEDYFDMAASYSAEGDYASAMQYLDNILRINPSNTQAQDLKRGLTHVMSKDNKTFVSSVNPMVKQAEEYRKIGDEDKELSSLLQGTQSMIIWRIIILEIFTEEIISIQRQLMHLILLFRLDLILLKVI